MTTDGRMSMPELLRAWSKSVSQERRATNTDDHQLGWIFKRAFAAKINAADMRYNENREQHS